MTWPDSNDLQVIDGKYQHRATGRRYDRITTVCKAADTGKERLIAWAVDQEREACFNAALQTWKEIGADDSFRDAMAIRLGAEKAHLKAMRKAGDFGTAVHQEIADRLRERITGQSRIPVPMSQDVKLTVDMFEAWHYESGLKPVLSEHKLHSDELQVAGQIDYLAEHPERGLGIVDFKTSNYVLSSHHVQVAAYQLLASKWADIRWACILHLPNKLGKAMKAVDLGQLYDRRLSYQQLVDCFNAALTIQRNLGE